MSKNEEIIGRLFKILCSYKQQPLELKDFLEANMKATYYPVREPIFRYNTVIKDALFVAEGYVACYGIDDDGNKQVVSITGKDCIIAGKSFMSQQPSAFEWVCLPGTYVLKINTITMLTVYERFPDSEELARMILSDNAEKELDRVKSLKLSASEVVLNFYTHHPEFLAIGKVMSDMDLATYLLISERSLRAVRKDLVMEGKINVK